MVMSLSSVCCKFFTKWTVLLRKWLWVPLYKLLLSRYLCGFLNEFSQYSDITKMSVGNIAIVIGPNLLWPREENADPAYVELIYIFMYLLENKYYSEHTVSIQ